MPSKNVRRSSAVIGCVSVFPVGGATWAAGAACAGSGAGPVEGCCALATPIAIHAASNKLVTKVLRIFFSRSFPSGRRAQRGVRHSPAVLRHDYLAVTIDDGRLAVLFQEQHRIHIHKI